jgi:excisionase family DNA binding protein
MNIEDKADQIARAVLPAFQAMVAAILREQQSPVHNQPSSTGTHTNEQPQDFLTVAEVANLLRVKTRTIYEWVSSGHIPHRKVGDRLLFLRSEVINWTATADNQTRNNKIRAVR